MRRFDRKTGVLDVQDRDKQVTGQLFLWHRVKQHTLTRNSMTLEIKLAQPWKGFFTYAQNLRVNSNIESGLTLPSLYIEIEGQEGFVVFSGEFGGGFRLKIAPVDLAEVQKHQGSYKNARYEIADFFFQGAELLETLQALQSATLIAGSPSGYCKGLWLCGANEMDMIIRPNYSLPGSLELRLLF